MKIDEATIYTRLDEEYTVRVEMYYDDDDLVIHRWFFHNGKDTHHQYWFMNKDIQLFLLEILKGRFDNERE